MEQNTTKALNLNRICQTNDQTNECNARHKTYNSAEKLNAIQMNFEHKPKIAGHSYRASKSTCACQALIISSKKKEKNTRFLIRKSVYQSWFECVMFSHNCEPFNFGGLFRN